MQSRMIYLSPCEDIWTILFCKLPLNLLWRPQMVNISGFGRYCYLPIGPYNVLLDYMSSASMDTCLRLVVTESGGRSYPLDS